MKDKNLIFKRYYHIVLGLFIICVIAITTSCESEDDENETVEFVSPKGFGASVETPEGSPLILPEGVTLESPIYTYNPFDDTDCNGEHLIGERGRETLVRLCLQFKNNTNSRIDVTLPPGLIFVSENIESQNGVLSEGLTIEVPAGQYLFAPIRAYCLNDSRSAPGLGDEFRFKVGPITTYQPMLDLFENLKYKKLTTGNPEENAMIVAKIQGLVWNLTHNKKLDEWNQRIFDELPNK